MKSKQAQWMAKRRAESMTPERRSEIARKAAKVSAAVRTAKAKARKRLENNP